MIDEMAINWYKFASPASFYPLAGRMIPWFALSAAVLAAMGLYVGLVVAPTDFQQGDAYRIIFIHVPAAWMSMFLYLGIIALRNAIDDPRRADRACSVLSLVGAVSVPIIYFSVKWWNTLHQGSLVSLTAAPRMAAIMLTGMLIMSFAAWFYAMAVVLMRVRAIWEQERAPRSARRLRSRIRASCAPS